MRVTTPASLAFLALIVTMTPVLGQAPPDFLEEFDGQFNASARKLVALAEATPEETYDWTPGEGVASVGRVFMHIARYNYYYPEVALGVQSPMGRAEYDTWEDDPGSKERVLEILSTSMDHVRDVAGSMSAEDLGTMTRLYGRDVGQWAVLLQLITHMNEHLGQSIAYARTNGVVPPWSR
jgi:uncharacterized damage-inducible protein DinB